MSQSDQPIQLERVSKRFGAFRVLDDVSLGVSQGEATVVLGRSGTAVMCVTAWAESLLEFFCEQSNYYF